MSNPLNVLCLQLSFIPMFFVLYYYLLARCVKVHAKSKALSPHHRPVFFSMCLHGSVRFWDFKRRGAATTRAVLCSKSFFPIWEREDEYNKIMMWSACSLARRRNNPPKWKMPHYFRPPSRIIQCWLKKEWDKKVKTSVLYWSKMSWIQCYFAFYCTVIEIFCDWKWLKFSGQKIYPLKAEATPSLTWMRWSSQQWWLT